MMKSKKVIERSQKLFQNFFRSIVNNLIDKETKHIFLKPLKIIQFYYGLNKFSTHPSIISIQKRMETNSNKLSFQYKKRKKFLTEIQNLAYRNASQQNNIPVKILTVTFALIYYIIMSITLFSNNFPKYLQRADITPVFKKDEKFLKTNYKPVSI